MLKRKDKILISALELLEAGGINGVTTKKLAEKEGVSEPALYRQYRSKLHIITSIIEEYASYDDKIMNTIIESGMHGKKAVLFYVKRYGELYQSYSELTTIMFSMDLFYYNEDTQKMMKEIIHNRVQFLRSIISEGQGCGEVDIHYTAAELSELIDGVIFASVFNWRMADKGYSLGDKMLTIITRLL